MGQMWIYYSRPTAEILTSTHQAQWTRAKLWTMQGHYTFENTLGHSRWYCPRLLQAMSIKNKRVPRVGARSSEVGWAIAIVWGFQAIDSSNVWGGTAMDSRQKHKRQMETTISIKWYGTQKLDWFASTANKCELHRFTNSSQKQHSQHLRPFVNDEIQFVGYTDQDDRLQTMLPLK